MLLDVRLGLGEGNISLIVLIEIVEPLVDDTLDFTVKVVGVGSWARCFDRFRLWLPDLRGRLALWLLGRLALWLLGRLALWLRGRLALWLRGRLALWL